jgi:hypothetical protein
LYFAFVEYANFRERKPWATAAVEQEFPKMFNKKPR